MYRCRVRCPDREVETLFPVLAGFMRAQFLVNIVMRSLPEQIAVVIGNENPLILYLQSIRSRNSLFCSCHKLTFFSPD